VLASVFEEEEMKAILLLLLPALMLIGCGEMQSNETAALNMLSNMEANGSINGEDLQLNDESLLNESVELSELNSNQIMLKLGGAELLIDFIDELSGEPEETAMIINGIEVAVGLLQNPQSFQALLASVISSQLEGVDILGIPAGHLIQIGMQLIRGDSAKADLSNLFGTLVRGALNMFLSKTPFGSLFEQVARPILDNVLPGGNQAGQNQQPNQNQNNNNNNSGGGIGGIIGTIGGLLTGGNPLLGGLVSLISNLFN
jgi:hypothetical protein